MVLSFKKKVLLFLTLNSFLFITIILWAALSSEKNQEVYIVLIFLASLALLFVWFFYFLMLKFSKQKKPKFVKNPLNNYEILQKITSFTGDIFISFSDNFQITWTNNPIKLSEVLKSYSAENFFFTNLKKILPKQKIIEIKNNNLKSFIFNKSTNKTIGNYLVSQVSENMLNFKPLKNQEKWWSLFLKERPVFFSLSIDQVSSFSESEQTFELKETEILAFIIVNLNDFLKEKKNIFMELTKGNFLIIMSQEDFENMQRNKFTNFIGKIKKDVNLKFAVDLTFSGGIFCHSELPDFFSAPKSQKINYEFAFNQAHRARKMAQSRGGDQIVINNEKENIKVIGQQRIILEKIPLIENKYKEFFGFINKYKEIILLCHINPDYDAIASSLVLKKLIEYMSPEIKCTFVSNSISEETEKQLKILTGKKNYKTSYQILKKIPTDKANKKLIIFLDTNNADFTDFPKDEIEMFDKAIFDHHTGTYSMKNVVFTFINQEFGAASEIIANFIRITLNKDEKFKIDKLYFNLLLAGILIDTNNLQSNIGKFTFSSVFFLQNQGVDVNLMTRKLKVIKIQEQKIIQEFEKIVVKNIISDDIASYKVVDKNATQVSAALFADHKLNIENAKMIIVFASRNLKDKVYVSIRSEEKNLNASMIGAALGGGGDHFRAGSQIINKNINQVEEHIKKIVQEKIILPTSKIIKIKK